MDVQNGENGVQNGAQNGDNPEDIAPAAPAEPVATETVAPPPPPPETASTPLAKDLLEPSLKLDISVIKRNLHKSDKAFAREVVKLIAERAENGIFARDCWGYKFLEPPAEERPYLKSTGWDDLIGFNAYSYRNRLPKVAELAKMDFELRGIGVETLNLYISERGIYCSWALAVPQ